jgi:hypothetical protein
MGFGEGIRDAIKGKSREISDVLSEKYRERVGAELLEREEKLKAREAEIAQRARQLDAREKQLLQRETQLRRHFHLRKAYVFVPILLAIAAAVAFSVIQWKKAGAPTSGPLSAPAQVGQPASLTDGSRLAMTSAWVQGSDADLT